MAALGGRRGRDRGRRALAALVGLTTAAALALLALRVVWPAAVVAAPRTEVRALAAGGLARSYRLHHPPRWDAEERLPLVLAFHGHRGTARVLEYEARLDEAADRAHVLVAYPEGTSALPEPFAGWPVVGRLLGALTRTWNVGSCCAPASTRGVDDVAFAEAVAHALVAEGHADSARVYATGFSIGGTLALKLACDRAGVVAAVASVEGTMPDTACAPARPVPVLLVRGGEDDELRADLRENRDSGGVYPFAGSMRAALAFWAGRNGCAGPVLRVRRERVALDTVAGCPAGAAVEMVLVHGNPHAWPGGRRAWLFGPAPAPGVPLDARMLAFFLRHRRDARATPSGGE